MCNNVLIHVALQCLSSPLSLDAHVNYVYDTDSDEVSELRRQDFIERLQEMHPDFPLPGSTIPRNKVDRESENLVPGNKAVDSEYEFMYTSRSLSLSHMHATPSHTTPHDKT